MRVEAPPEQLRIHAVRLPPWVGALFPPPSRERQERVAGPSRRAVLWGVVGSIAAGAVAIFRTGGAGALNTVWIEDAHFFLTEALAKPFGENVFNPLNGYFHTGPRLLAEIASAVPVRWSAAVLALLAVAMQVAFAAVAYVASGPLLERWWLRLLVAAPVVAVPVGHTQADNDLATLQFPSLYALFWILLWRPRTTAAKVAAVALTLYIATSSILPIVFVPLVLLRLFATRDWISRGIAGAYFVGMAVQLGGVLTGTTTRQFGAPNYNPIWVMREYATKALPRSILGERWLGGPGIHPMFGTVIPPTNGRFERLTLMLVAMLIVAAVVTIALLKVTRPHWPLAILAAGSSVAVFAEAIVSMGRTHPRYVIPAALLLYVAMAAVLRPWPRSLSRAESSAASLARPQVRPRFLRPVRSWQPAAAFAVLLVVVCAVNLRGPNSRSESQGWDVTVSRAEVACATTQITAFEYRYSWWSVLIPCDRVR